MLDFATRLISWQKVHGRHDLPWQNTQDAYAIWVSEIMLQQTQVTAVIGYYARFMQRFPTIASLAVATQDEVLQHWSGLGYYSRARNLHQAARNIMELHQGVFPEDFVSIQALPGIGRSTAAAIASFAFNQVQTILDGNVKRVLARHFEIEGWPGLPRVEKQLWLLAEQLLPPHDMVAYTQGLMDLGATLCTRSQPRCEACPLLASCGAYASGRVRQLPASKPRKVTPQRQTTMLLLLRDGQVMLEKRPSSGIWGGLWSLPEIGMQEIATEVVAARFGLQAEAGEPLASVHHAFTHFKLEIVPQPMQVVALPLQAQQAELTWLPLQTAIDAALPTPVRRILQGLQAGPTAQMRLV